jgi:hypothetical protein
MDMSADLRVHWSKLQPKGEGLCTYSLKNKLSFSYENMTKDKRNKQSLDSGLLFMLSKDIFLILDIGLYIIYFSLIV